MADSFQFPETADIETSSDDYARRFAGEVGAWFLQVQEAVTLKMLAPYPNATVLDVGGGHGQVTGGLIENCYQVTVLGSDESCKARIRHWVDRRACSFNVGNILDLPYPDQSFDVVLSYRLLPHVTQWRTFIAELARVAKKAVILDYPEVRSINYIAPYLFPFKKHLEGNTRPFSCFREAQLTGVFQPHRFVLAERYAEFFLPMVLHRKLKKPGLSGQLENKARSIGITGWLGSPVILKFVRTGGKN